MGGSVDAIAMADDAQMRVGSEVWAFWPNRGESCHAKAVIRTRADDGFVVVLLEAASPPRMAGHFPAGSEVIIPRYGHDAWDAGIWLATPYTEVSPV